MITTMLQGGLGNQMFQYAHGLAQARRLGVELQLDTGLLDNDGLRQYNLDLFSGVDEAITKGSKANVIERGLPYDESLYYHVKDGDVLRGYWQCEDYFGGLVPLLFAKFKPKAGIPSNMQYLVDDIKSSPSSTFLTIRRTDYIKKQEFHGVLPIEYYREALGLIHSKTGIAPRVFVFSDDPQWCKESLYLNYPFVLAGSFDQTTPTHLGREDIDMYLMSLCRHAVMANSSFSWWGAWLGDFTRQPRVVIGPSQWFTSSAVDSRDIIPERWIRL